MYCPKCGAEIKDGSKFCGSCGAPVRSAAPNATSADSNQPRPSAAPNQPTQGKGLGGLITVIVIACVAAAIGIFFVLDPFGFFHPGQTPESDVSLESSYSGIPDVDGQSDTSSIDPSTIKVDVTGFEITDNKLRVTGSVANEGNELVAALGFDFKITYDYQNTYDEIKEDEVEEEPESFYDINSMSISIPENLMYNLQPGETRDFFCYVKCPSTMIKNVECVSTSPMTNQEFAKEIMSTSSEAGFLSNDQYDISIDFTTNTDEKDNKCNVTLTNKTDEYWNSPEIIALAEYDDSTSIRFNLDIQNIAPGGTRQVEYDTYFLLHRWEKPKKCTIIGVYRTIGQPD